MNKRAQERFALNWIIGQSHVRPQRKNYNRMKDNNSVPCYSCGKESQACINMDSWGDVQISDEIFM